MGEVPRRGIISPIMRVVVVGAGAVGGYYGAKLSMAGHEVYFVARGEHLASIKRDGLVVESFNGDFTVRPSGASEHFEPLGGVDLVLVCVKRGDTADALGAIAGQVENETVVISLQNGLDADKEMAAVVEPSRIVGGIAFIGSAVSAPGRIRHTARGVVTIGEADGSQSERALKIQKTFEDAGIPCAVSPDIVGAKWDKLMWNVGFNGVCALTRGTVHKVLDHAPTADLARSLMEELVGVADELGINVNRSLVDKYIVNTRKGGDVTPSTLQDVMHGKRTEIKYMNGKVCEEGRKTGYPTPYNDAVFALVSALDEMRK